MIDTILNEFDVENCFSRGNVTRLIYDQSFGGFCGSSENSFIFLCYSTGSVTYTSGTDPTDKGFLGESTGYTSVYMSNLFDNELSNQLTDDTGAATPKTTLEMKTVSTFTDEWWDFVGESANGDDDFWNIDPEINDGYPYLVSFYESAPLPAPQNLSISIFGNEVILNWDAVPGATAYKVYSSSVPYDNFEEDNSGSFDANSWGAPLPAGETKMFYRVTASAE